VARPGPLRRAGRASWRAYTRGLIQRRFLSAALRKSAHGFVSPCDSRDVWAKLLWAGLNLRPEDVAPGRKVEGEIRGQGGRFAGSPLLPRPNLRNVSGTLREPNQECPRPSRRSRIQSAEGPQSRGAWHGLRWQPIGSVHSSQATRPHPEVRAYPHRRAEPFQPVSLAGFVELHH
jgi:hypothetical protein